MKAKSLSQNRVEKRGPVELFHRTIVSSYGEALFSKSRLYCRVLAERAEGPGYEHGAVFVRQPRTLKCVGRHGGFDEERK